MANATFLYKFVAWKSHKFLNFLFYAASINSRQAEGEISMANFNKLNNLKKQLGSDSASWGSLAILAIAISILLLLMVSYSHAGIALYS